MPTRKKPIAEYTIRTQSCVTPDPCIPAVKNENGSSHPIAGRLCYVTKSRLPKKSSCNVSHICFLKLIVFPIISVDIDIVESFNDSVNVKTHVDKSVDQVFVVPLISIHTSAQIHTS